MKREITYVDEVSEACLFFLEQKTKHSLINIGSGYEKTIKSFIKFIATKLRVKSKIMFNNDEFLDGTPRKIVDTTIARSYGWKPQYNFEKSFEITLRSYINNYDQK